MDANEVSVGVFISKNPYEMTVEEYSQYLKGLKNVDDAITISKIDYDEILKLRKKVASEAVERAENAIREQMLESPSAKLWGTLDDGTNQGIKHFADYWERYPERIPSLAERLWTAPCQVDRKIK